MYFSVFLKAPSPWDKAVVIQHVSEAALAQGAIGRNHVVHNHSCDPGGMAAEQMNVFGTSRRVIRPGASEPTGCIPARA